MEAGGGSGDPFGERGEFDENDQDRTAIIVIEYQDRQSPDNTVLAMIK